MDKANFGKLAGHKEALGHLSNASKAGKPKVSIKMTVAPAKPKGIGKAPKGIGKGC